MANRSFIVEHDRANKTLGYWLALQTIFLALQYVALRIIAEFSNWAWDTEFGIRDTLFFLFAVKIASLTLSVRWVDRR